MKIEKNYTEAEILSMPTIRVCELQKGDKVIADDGFAKTIVTITNGMYLHSKCLTFDDETFSNKLNNTEVYVVS